MSCFPFISCVCVCVAGCGFGCGFGCVSMILFFTLCACVVLCFHGSYRVSRLTQHFKNFRTNFVAVKIWASARKAVLAFLKFWQKEFSSFQKQGYNMFETVLIIFFYFSESCLLVNWIVLQPFHCNQILFALLLIAWFLSLISTPLSMFFVVYSFDCNIFLQWKIIQ